MTVAFAKQMFLLHLKGVFFFFFLKKTKTGRVQKNTDGAVWHGGERGPQPDPQGEDEDDYELHLSSDRTEE